MKYFKKLGLYKSSNVTFNPKTKESYSYGWWKLTGVIDGKLVFNNYPYSTTTQRHQRKIRALLTDLGINIDLELEAPRGLDDLPSAHSHYMNKIKSLEQLINNPRTKAAKNEERKKEIEVCKEKLKFLSH